MLPLRRNADPGLRILERAYAAGDLDAGVAYLQGRVRARTLPQAALTQLSVLGEPAARRLVPKPEAGGVRLEPVEEWFIWIGAYSHPHLRPWRNNYLAPAGWRFGVRLALAAARGACTRYWLKHHDDANDPAVVEAYQGLLLSYAGMPFWGTRDSRRAFQQAVEAWTPWSIFQVVEHGTTDLRALEADSMAGFDAAEEAGMEWDEHDEALVESSDHWDHAASQAGFSAAETGEALHCALDSPDTLQWWADSVLDALEHAYRATNEFHEAGQNAWDVVAQDIQKEVIPWLLA